MLSRETISELRRQLGLGLGALALIPRRREDLFELLAFYEQFAPFERELDTLIDRVRSLHLDAMAAKAGIPWPTSGGDLLPSDVTDPVDRAAIDLLVRMSEDPDAERKPPTTETVRAANALISAMLVKYRKDGVGFAGWPKIDRGQGKPDGEEGVAAIPDFSPRARVDSLPSGRRPLKKEDPSALHIGKGAGSLCGLSSSEVRAVTDGPEWADCIDCLAELYGTVHSSGSEPIGVALHGSVPAIRDGKRDGHMVTVQLGGSAPTTRDPKECHCGSGWHCPVHPDLVAHTIADLESRRDRLDPKARHAPASAGVVTSCGLYLTTDGSGAILPVDSDCAPVATDSEDEITCRACIEGLRARVDPQPPTEARP